MKTIILNSIVYLFLILTATISSCSKVKDEQPGPIEEPVPDAVARVLADAYPNAKEISLETIEKDKEWEARFSQGEVQYYVTLNPSKILATHRLISETVPDSIKKFFEVIPILSPNKGVLSDFREILNPSASDRNYTAKFTVDQKDYLLTFRTYNQPADNYDVTVTSYYKFSYYELNDQISNYLLDKNYANVFARVIVLADNKKQYTTWTNHVNGETGDMVFDDQKKLIVSFRKVEAISTLAALPENIQNFIKNTGLQLSDQNYKFAENGVSGYHVFLLGITGIRGYRYALDFDLEGNVITSRLNIAIVGNRK
ncbi:hypothetical protein L0657_05570 [Dyadobacter sp. CY345]|uniref:hypothetical protein n=1 Tax=Dyadobacter sp. CY345 TaxID=2909335 RepID=UPI001F2D6E27|nr:hypothetical protein [Dyadobacter sp. CY345]MCF2443418.1 hypothetical protein [Dyadobacter sp. CY345]